MKKLFQSKIWIILALLIFLFIFFDHSSVSASGTWETVCSSGGFSSSDFFTDDFAVAANGTLYCLDSARREVVVFDGNKATVFLSEPANDFTRLCLSKDDKTLYLLDINVNKIKKVTLANKASEIIDLSSSNIPAIAPIDLTISEGHTIYIADYSGNCVYIYDADKSVKKLVDAGDAGALSGPFCIDINSHDKLAISLDGRNQVVFTRSYDDKFMACNTTAADGGAVGYLHWSAIDEYNNVYQVDSETNRIIALLSQSGTYRTLYPTSNSNENIVSICTSGNYLYACIGAQDYSSFRILRCAIKNEVVSMSFSGLQADADINTKTHSISITLPSGADTTSLKPNIVVSDGASVSINTNNKYDFSNPFTFTVSSNIYGPAEYKVTVNKAAATQPPGQTQLPASIAPSSSQSAEATDNSGSEVMLFYALASGYFLILVLLIVLIFVLKKRKKHKLMIILTLIWLALGIALTFIGIWMSSNEKDSVFVKNAAYDVQSDEAYEMSTSQKAILSEYGSPDSFLIMYIGQSRQETWFYYKKGLMFDFLGGIEINKEYDQSLKAIDAKKTPYSPDDYVYSMTPGTTLSVAGVQDFLMEPLEDEMLKGGVLYYADGIIFGFMDNKLYYVETILSEE